MTVEQKHLTLLSVWAIGVGSALGGVFFGWQFVLYGGFSSAMWSVGFAAAFYWMYAGAITELAARYKVGGGSFDFVRIALGERWATIMGILNLMKLLLANAATAMVISSYLGTGGYPGGFKFIIWLVVYITFTTLDCIGITHSVKAQFVATALCVCLLMFYGVASSTIFHASNLMSSGLTDSSMLGFMKGLPFAFQFFDGFEEIPLLMNYTQNAEKTIPQGILVCYLTITCLAVLVLVTTAAATSAKSLLHSEAPLMDVIELVFGVGTPISDIFAYLICMGLILNFFAFIIYSSQQLQFIAATGRLPYFLAYRNNDSGSPVAASILCSIAGLTMVFSFALLLGEKKAQNTLLVASMIPGIIGYILTLECICSIRKVERSASEAVISKVRGAREHEVLGTDPPLRMRFSLGLLGVRAAQLMCWVVIAGFLVLCFEWDDYLYGLIVIMVVGVLLYVLILRVMPFDLHRTDVSALSVSIMDDPDARLDALKHAAQFSSSPAAMAVPQYDSLYDDSESAFLISTNNPVTGGNSYEDREERKRRLSLGPVSLHDVLVGSMATPNDSDAEHDFNHNTLFASSSANESTGFISENPIGSRDTKGRRPSIRVSAEDY